MEKDTGKVREFCHPGKVETLYCHTTCPLDITVVIPEQFAVPLARIDPICPSDSECHLLRSLSTAVLGAEMNVGVRVTLDTEFCWCYAVQPQDFSCCRIWVTLDTVYNCWCYAFICQNGLAVKVRCRQLEIPPNYIHGREYSPSSDQLHALGNANLYLSPALCIRLNSSKIHCSNNHAAAYTAPFIPPHALQLLIQCTYQHPQPRIQHPLSFEYFTSCSLSTCTYHNARTVVMWMSTTMCITLACAFYWGSVGDCTSGLVAGSRDSR